MKTIAMLFAAMLSACTTSDDAVSVIEQDVRTVDCDDRIESLSCSECGWGGKTACCADDKGNTDPDCKVLCKDWVKDPKSGKNLYCGTI